MPPSRFAQVMVYARRIDLPQELISVADDNLADHWDEAAKKYPTQVTVLCPFFSLGVVCSNLPDTLSKNHFH